MLRLTSCVRVSSTIGNYHQITYNCVLWWMNSNFQRTHIDQRIRTCVMRCESFIRTVWCKQFYNYRGEIMGEIRDLMYVWSYLIAKLFWRSLQVAKFLILSIKLIILISWTIVETWSIVELLHEFYLVPCFPFINNSFW